MSSSSNADKDSSSIGESISSDITGPLVFSCSSCKTIVGDSYAFICSNESLKSITLSAANNIERSADVYTSKGGYDIGSTYFSFACSVCHASIGRYYLTTSKDLDQIREKFTFAIDNISSYEVGKSKFGKMPEPEIFTFGGDDDGLSSSQNSNIADDILKVICHSVVVFKLHLRVSLVVLFQILRQLLTFFFHRRSSM